MQICPNRPDPVRGVSTKLACNDAIHSGLNSDRPGLSTDGNQLEPANHIFPCHHNSRQLRNKQEGDAEDVLLDFSHFLQGLRSVSLFNAVTRSGLEACYAGSFSPFCSRGGNQNEGSPSLASVGKKLPTWWASAIDQLLLLFESRLLFVGWWRPAVVGIQICLHSLGRTHRFERPRRKMRPPQGGAVTVELIPCNDRHVFVDMPANCVVWDGDGSPALLLKHLIKTTVEP